MTPRIPAHLRGNPLESRRLFPMDGEFMCPAVDDATADLIVGRLRALAAAGGVRVRVWRDGLEVKAVRA